MEKQYKVLEITNPTAKEGISAKTNKPWSMSSVRIEGGKEVFVFNPVKEGDMLRPVQNGEYTNWNVIKPDSRHDEIMQAMRAQYKLSQAIFESITGSVHKEEKPTPKVDVVAEVEDDEEIDLNSIPF